MTALSIPFRTTEGYSLRVLDDPAELANPDTLVVNEHSIRIDYTYPLHNPTNFNHENNHGFTRLQLFQLIGADYQKIYQEPTRHGIWGHTLEDLFLEGVELNGNVLSLGMGS